MRKYGQKRHLVIVSSSDIWYQKSLNDTKFSYYAALQITMQKNVHASIQDTQQKCMRFV